jgi:hypothetical protein
MRVPAKVREAEDRLAFRLAVRACLEVYYGQSVAESHANADAWWGRISTTSAFKSGFFMHSEPISTAARIAKRPYVELSEQDGEAYEKLLEECWIRAKEDSMTTVEVGRGGDLKGKLRTVPSRAVASPRPKRAVVAKQA